MNVSTKPGESSHHSAPSIGLLGRAAASLVALASSASGAVVTTTSLETWTGWVAGPVTQLTFADVGPAPMLFTTQYAEFGVTATQGDDWIRPTSSWDGIGLAGKSPFEPGDPTIELAFSAPIMAFAVRYLHSIELDLYSGSALVGSSGVLVSGVTLGFGGVLSEIAFDSVHLKKPSLGDTVRLDDLYLPTIPAPASALILILGASSSRRRCCGGSRGLEG